MVLSLGLITLVASGGLALVHHATESAIEATKQGNTTDALSKVIEEFDNDPAAETTSLELDGMPVKVYTGRKGYEPSGYAVETMTKAGFAGEIRMMVGFRPDGEIYNIEVLQQNETPGLGSKMTEPDNPLILSFQGRNPADMKMSVTKDGGDVDAITASTISSRAYVDAVARAYTAFRQVALGVTEEPVDFTAAVLPAYDTVFVISRAELVAADSLVSEDTVHKAVKGDETVGYAVETVNPDGYHGPIRLMVGFLPDGTINGIAVMESNETPEFGAQISEPDNVLLASMKGRNAADIEFGLKPAADGETGATGAVADRGPEGDVDGISGATVTSKAYVEAVAHAWRTFTNITKQDGNE